MSHTPHEIAAEFPEMAERIGELKRSDPHFARLTEDYQELNRQVYLAQSKVAPTDTFHETELRRKRLALKDAIWKILSAPS